MTDLRKAAGMALDALEILSKNELPKKGAAKAELDEVVIPALRQALAQPEQEPVAWIFESNYTAPPKREWVGLTEEEVEAWRGNYDFFDSALVREVEAKLKEKNT